MYLNYIKSANADTMPATLDLTGSSSLYLRSQADVNALMTAIENHADKGNITTINVRLAPGNVGSDITFGTGVSVINPSMNITVTGATNNGKLITASDTHFAGSFTSTGKTVTQDFASTVVDKTVQGNWTSYFKYVLSSAADGGLGQVSIVAPALTHADHLTAMMGSLNGLSVGLKASIQHLHLDVSHASFNSGLTLGTGVSGLSNLQEVTYIRASAEVDATAAAVGAGDFTSKLQRLRTAWNSDSLASAVTVGEYLRYVLMDTAMGGAELTLVDLTTQVLDGTGDGDLYTAIQNLPSELLSRVTELRLNFNTTTSGNYSGITLPNLTTVKYFQVSDDTDEGFTFNFVAPNASIAATVTQFRTLDQVFDKTDQDQWAEYIDYRLTAVNSGGLGLITFDLSGTTLTSAQAAPFLAALNAHASAERVTAITLKLDSTFGAASLDLSSYSNLTGLVNDNVIILRNAAVNALYPVSITYGGSFTDAKVQIVDPETNTTADKDNTRQEWLEYLTNTINTVGLTSGLLTIAPGDAFTSQSQIYLLFDAMEALDPSLKAEITKIIIDISSIASGTVSLMRTGEAALTGFNNLSNVIYKRAGLDTNIDTIITSLQTALDAEITVPGTVPAWVFADEAASDTAIAYATHEYTGSSARSAILQGNTENLKSELITLLANGITFPASDVLDADVETAAGAVDVTVDGDQKLTLATALTPFRSTGKVSAIETAISDAFTDGSTTGLGTLPWLKAAWAGYADQDAVMADVLADGIVSAEIAQHDSSIADIKTVVKNKLHAIIIPTGGSLTGVLAGINFTELAGWGTSVLNFKAALDSVLVAALATAYPQYVTAGTSYPNAISCAALDGWTWNNDANGWDTASSGAALKTALQARLLTQVTTNAECGAGLLDTAIDAAFTAADLGDALTDGTAAWLRPTTGIESDLKASIQTALGALPWYTGNADAQSTAAMTAGDVANQNAATIISNIKTWLTQNVARPTANSLFQTPVGAAVDSISLATASTAVTTDFAGVAETLSRYRVDVNDISNKESAAQWVEYLLYQLSPAALGGLGATTIDVSAAPFTNDHKTNFMAALGALPDNLRTGVTSIKLAAGNGVGNLDGGDKAYNNNLKIIMVMDAYSNGTPTLSAAGGQEFFAADGAAPLDSANVIDYRITSTPAVTGSAIEWQRWLNHKLSSTFGGDGVTAIDLSATHAFASQAQLNEFFAGLDALDGTGAMANKNLLQNLTLKLVAGNFGAASARIGYTGSGAVTNLNANINVTVQRNGAINGAGLESELVTVDHSDIDAISAADGVTVDNTDAVDVDNLSSSAEWLEYLNSTLTAAGAAYTLDLTAVGLQLQVGTSATEATALFNALQALDSTLKAKVDTIKIKLAAGNHGAVALALSGTLSIAAGFTALARIIVDATDAETDVAGTQKTIDFAGVTVEGSVKTVTWVDNLASVDFDSANSTDSWGYYFNYLKAVNGNIESIDLSTRDLADTDSGTTQPYVDAFFSALNAHADKATVKDIYLNISGVDSLALNVGTGSAGLTALTSVVIQRHAGAGSTFTPAGDVGAADLTVISSATGTLGDNGTTAQWKGYLGYLLEEVSHGGIYAGGAPIALNLTATALQINSLAVLQALEQAIAELPARLKERISALVIKTTDANVDYTSVGTYEFGDAFTGSALSELNSLKLVIIESCTTGTDPVYDTDGDFSNALSIGKIVYHTTINVS